MCKYVAFYVLTLAILAFIGLELVRSDGSDTEFPVALTDREREIEQRIAAYRRFRDVLEPTIAGLLKREIRLKDACAQVHAAARADAPNYLNRLPETHLGKSLQARIGRNLLGHVQGRVRLPHVAPAPLQALEDELREMIAEVE